MLSSGTKHTNKDDRRSSKYKYDHCDWVGSPSNPSIKFTWEEVQDNQLPVLNFMIKRDSNHKPRFAVERKPTCKDPLTTRKWNQESWSVSSFEHSGFAGHLRSTWRTSSITSLKRSKGSTIPGVCCCASTGQWLLSRSGALASASRTFGQSSWLLTLSWRNNWRHIWVTTWESPLQHRRRS